MNHEDEIEGPGGAERPEDAPRTRQPDTSAAGTYDPLPVVGDTPDEGDDDETTGDPDEPGWTRQRREDPDAPTGNTRDPKRIEDEFYADGD